MTNNIMRATVVLFSFLFLSSVNAQRQFKILEATLQVWTGGAHSGGSGVNYRLMLLVHKSSSKLILDTLWTGDACYPLLLSHAGRGNPGSGFMKNDTIYLSASKRNPMEPDGKGEKATYKAGEKNCIAPIVFNGTALLGYRYRGKRKYMTLLKFKELPPLRYP